VSPLRRIFWVWVLSTTNGARVSRCHTSSRLWLVAGQVTGKGRAGRRARAASRRFGGVLGSRSASLAVVVTTCRFGTRRPAFPADTLAREPGWSAQLPAASVPHGGPALAGSCPPCGASGRSESWSTEHDRERIGRRSAAGLGPRASGRPPCAARHT